MVRDVSFTTSVFVRTLGYFRIFALVPFNVGSSPKMLRFGRKPLLGNDCVSTPPARTCTFAKLCGPSTVTVQLLRVRSSPSKKMLSGPMRVSLVKTAAWSGEPKAARVRERRTNRSDVFFGFIAESLGRSRGAEQFMAN